MSVHPSDQTVQPLRRADEADAATLHEHIATLVSSRGLIAAVAGGVLVLGVLYARLATPIYRSDVLLQVEEKKASIAGLDDLANMFPSENAADTEIEILRSRSLVEGVVRKLSLNISVAPRRFPLIGSPLSRAWHGAGVAPAFLGLSSFAWGGERIAVDRFEVPSELENEKFTLTAAGENGYRVDDPDGRPMLEGQAGVAAEAGRVRIFVSQLQARPGTRFVLVRQPESQVAEGLQESLVIFEKGKKTGIIRVELSGPDVGALVRTLDELSTAYLRQNVERKSEEAQKTLEFINAQLPEQKARVDKAEEALNDYRSKHGTIDLTLEAKAAIERAVDIEKAASELNLQKAELAQRFTPSHPFVLALQKKIAEIDGERTRMNARIKTLPESELMSARLLRDVKVANELYVILLNKAQELRVVKSGTIGNVRILDRAFAPRRPVFPKLGVTASLALMFGLALGVVAAFAARALNRGIEDPDVLEAATGLSVYAVVPHSDQQVSPQRTRGKGRARGPVGILAKQFPTDLAVESLRSLRTSLQFALMDAPNRVIAFGGPSPGIGKSFVASNLAHLLADSGRRVLLIDADMRMGSLHHIFGVAREPGLSDVIAGAVPFSDAVHRELSPNLDLLSQGLVPPNPSELLMSPRFRELIDRVGKEYELVILDTPPILAVTDAAIIARLAGVTLMVIRAGQHPLREVTMALKRFTQSGVKPAGLVFNDVVRRATNAAYHYQYDYRKPEAKAG